MQFIDETGTGFCEIKLKGRLESRWGDWFDRMKISVEDHVTIISGTVPDQAALRGVVERISMLGMTIISIDFKSSLD